MRYRIIDNEAIIGRSEIARWFFESVRNVDNDLFSHPLAAPIVANIPINPCTIWGIEKSFSLKAAWLMLIRPNKVIEVPANPATTSVALEIASTLAFKASPQGK